MRASAEQEHEARVPVVGTPKSATGRERETFESDESGRTVADVALYLPRNVLDLLFITTGAASGLIEDEQVVPRLKDTFYSENHEIGVFPTAFVETGFTPNIGARMIASIDNFASTLRAGYGGPDSTVVESRIRMTSGCRIPLSLSIEWLQDRRTDLVFMGLGPSPEQDPRNQFRPLQLSRNGLYRERRQRMIAGVGVRLAPDWVLVLSNGLKSRHVDDAPDAGSDQLSRVFEPSSIPGANRITRTVYTEAALRFDSRENRGAPTTGAMMEAYGGVYNGIRSQGASAVASGVRWAAFLPLYRVTNVISPRITIDTITPLGDAPLPFFDYLSAADFRGFDGRRDRVVMVASVDYRWTLIQYIAARVFGDATNVAPEVSSLALEHARYAWGLGFDLHSASTQIGRVAASFSQGDMRLFLSLGVAPSGFGDRQHR